MSEARRVVPTVSAPLTWAEICEQYPDAWVVLVDIDWVNDTVTGRLTTPHAVTVLVGTGVGTVRLVPLSRIQD